MKQRLILPVVSCIMLVLACCMATSQLLAPKLYLTIAGVAQPSGVHAPVGISNDTALASFPDKTGNGLANDPYIIKDLVINAAGSGNCISINNTRLYIVIQNCTFSNASNTYGRAGVRLQNASNIVVTNCTFLSDAWCGFYAYNSTRIDITNSVFNEPQYTVSSYASSFIDIEDNTITGYYGVDLSNTNHSIVTLNEISGATGNGITISYGLNVSVSLNRAYDNLDGVLVESSVNVLVSQNDVSYNRNDGISLLASDHCTVVRNKAYFCGKQGAQLTNAPSNTIMENTFVYNGADGLCLQMNSHDTIIQYNRLLGNLRTDLEIKDTGGNTIEHNVYCSLNDWGTTNTMNNNTCQQIPDLNPSYTDFQQAAHAVVDKVATISFTFNSQPVIYALYLCVMFVDNTTTTKVLLASAFLLTENDKFVSNAIATLTFNLTFAAQGFNSNLSGSVASQAPMISFGESIHIFRLHFEEVESTLFPMDLNVTLEYAVSGTGFSKNGVYQATKNFPGTTPAVPFATAVFGFALFMCAVASVYMMRKRANFQ